jgi:CDP-glucose 4,6-dehydratase
MVKADPAFWRGKKVLLTGHTGFKGAWLTFWLARMGAKVTALSLPPDQSPSLWAQIESDLDVRSILADIRDVSALNEALGDGPQIVIHLAAQALVGRGYREPAETFSVNVMGTVTLLEALKTRSSLACVLVVTSDKVYRERDDGKGSREDNCLGGSDPYSASKAAQDIAAYSYAKSFFEPVSIPLITGRAGNVVGGGDWSEQRLIPDIWRAANSKTPLEVRYPDATRPWQHVLDCLHGYLCYVESVIARTTKQQGASYPRHLNFAPQSARELTVAEVISIAGSAMGVTAPWKRAAGPIPPENPHLAIDASLAQRYLGWTVKLDQNDTLQWTADWYRRHRAGEKASSLCAEQIDRFCEDRL